MKDRIVFFGGKLLTSSEIRNCPRNDHTRNENLVTQPLRRQKIFNEPYIITKGWYPICRSKNLKLKTAKSFNILKQRIVLYRGEDGKAYALDSFCPHMGADLGNGEVKSSNIRCFFHHWEFNASGEVESPSCLKEKTTSEKTKLNAYPVEEKYNHIWVFSDGIKTHDVPTPPALQSFDISSYFFKRVRLFAHHHIMMTNGIDLQHFKSVHDLDVKFDCHIKEHGDSQFEWTLEGEIPSHKMYLKFARFVLGAKFRYKVLFSGGSVTSISYGFNQRWRGKGRELPAINILWGGIPTIDGVSEVDIFFIYKKYKGFLAPLKSLATFLLSMIVLGILKDDDIKAFPHMRYNVGHFTAEDSSVSKFIQLTNNLEVSNWTN